MKLHRGDVILINYPYSDASGSKVRPAVVVQADSRNAVLTETIIALITKNLRFVGTDPTQLLIDLGTSDGRATGLNINSAVRCGKLFTVHESLVVRKIGVLSTVLLTKVDNCLRAALELP